MKMVVGLTKSLLSLLLFLSTDSLAYQLKEQTLSELFYSAVQVSRIKVIGSKQVVYKKDNISYNCGFDYSANVVTGFKGNSSSFTFRSFSQFVSGKEYLVFLNDEYLDAVANYLSMGKNDKAGYEACTGEKLLYASGFHGEVFEFDSLWKTVTGKDAVKFALDASYLEKLSAKKVVFKSEQVSEAYLEALSYWRIDWDILEAKLLTIPISK